MIDTMDKIISIDELTHKIIGCAMKVHRVLGNGFQEVIYQRALEIEFRLQQVNAVREMEMKIHYEGFEIGTRRVDFFVEDAVMVELKAVSTGLEDVHKAQAINYLEAYGIADGLLINFGKTSLEFKRVFNKNLVKRNSESKNLESKNPDNLVNLKNPVQE
jgi:GxxExxY protein